MIDIYKLDGVKTLWVIEYVTLWESRYGDDALEFPVGVVEKKIVGVTGHIVHLSDGTRLSADSLYYTKEEAEKNLDLKQKEDWEYHHCDFMLQKLSEIKKQILGDKDGLGKV